MARRFTHAELGDAVNHPTSGPVPLSNMIRLQPNRKKGKSMWRPLQPEDLDADNGAYHTATPDRDDNASQHRPGSGHLQDSTSFDQVYVTPSARPSPNDLPSLRTTFTTSPLAQRQASRTACEPAGEPQSNYNEMSLAAGEISPTDPRDGTDAYIVRVFGRRLPDAATLNGAEGKHDGEIAFIALPSRDVEAHQWSLEKFQWVLVGSYSYARRRIEGSLASDRLKGQTISSSLPPNSLHYFRAVAEQRERLVVDEGHAVLEDEDKEMSPLTRRADEQRRPLLSDAGHFASLSGSSEDVVPAMGSLSMQNAPARVSTRPMQSTHVVAGQHLDDPFVNAAKYLQPMAPQPLYAANPYPGQSLRGGGDGAVAVAGMMDYQFEFPTRSGAFSGSNSQQANDEETRRRLFMQRIQAETQSWTDRTKAQARLRDIEVGEDAMSGPSPEAQHVSFRRPSVPASPEDVRMRAKLKTRLVQLGDQVSQAALSLDNRVAVPELAWLALPPRTVLPPPPGLTVANPHRVKSKLNAHAEPYTHSSMNVQSPERSGSEITAINVRSTTNLQFSDPDGIRQQYVPEIATGLAQEPPTPQNFRGPFFTSSMPTANNPTAPLDNRAKDELEKLANWFQGGQRSARQGEFTEKILEAHKKEQGRRNLGAIGDSLASRTGEANKYENTHMFVTLYETLREYADESKAKRVPGNENSQVWNDPFTRAWKPAPAHLCDLTPGGNNSFFGDRRAAALQPKATANVYQPQSGAAPSAPSVSSTSKASAIRNSFWKY